MRAGGGASLSGQSFHGIDAAKGDEGATVRRSFSGVIRSPVPTGVLINHVGLRRQQEN
jgi:hypothetical protein